jgi:hypothetical protein
LFTCSVRDVKLPVMETSGRSNVLTEAASRALPQAVRQRRPALPALRVLLVLGGALATGLLVVRVDERVSVIRVTARIGAGVRSRGSVRIVLSSAAA